MHRKIHVLPAKNARATPHNSRLTAKAPLRRLRHGICVAKDVDLNFLSTEITGGFTGCTVGMYASANGTASTNHAAFYWFAYQQVRNKLR